MEGGRDGGLNLRRGMVHWWWWDSGEVPALKNGGDGELQQAAVAAKSGAERDRGAFNHSATLVIVLAAVRDRDVCACACSSKFTGGFLGLNRDR